MTAQLFYSWSERVECFEARQGSMNEAEALLMENVRQNAAPAVERPIAVVARPSNEQRARRPTCGADELNNDTSRKDGYSHDSASKFKEAVARMRAMEATCPQQAQLAVDLPPPVPAASPLEKAKACAMAVKDAGLSSAWAADCQRRLEEEVKARVRELDASTPDDGELRQSRLADFARIAIDEQIAERAPHVDATRPCRTWSWRSVSASTVCARAAAARPC